MLENEPLFHIIDGIFQRQIKEIGEWADQLHFSESSLLRYFKMVENELARYRLTLSLKKVDFIGKEIDIRSFFHDFYYESEITPHGLAINCHPVDCLCLTKSTSSVAIPMFLWEILVIL